MANRTRIGRIAEQSNAQEQNQAEYEFRQRRTAGISAAKRPLRLRISDAVKATATVLESVCQAIDPRPATKSETPGATAVVPATVRVVTEPHTKAPGWSDGRDIWLNYPHIVDHNEVAEGVERELRGLPQSPWDFIDIASLKGLIYHEDSHVLFSPRAKSQLREWLVAYPTFHRAWNILEDQRIESIFVISFPGARGYFTATIAQHLLGTEEAAGMAHAWTYGRRYLPVELRAAYRNSWAAGDLLRKEAEACIDEFAQFPSDWHHDKSQADDADWLAIKAVVERFNRVLQQLNGPALDASESGLSTDHVMSPYGRDVEVGDDVEEAVADGIANDEIDEEAERQKAEGVPSGIAYDDEEEEDADGEGAGGGDSDEADGEGAGSGDGDEADNGDSDPVKGDGDQGADNEGGETDGGDGESDSKGWAVNPDATDETSAPVAPSDDDEEEDADGDPLKDLTESVLDDALWEIEDDVDSIKTAAVTALQSGQSLGVVTEYQDERAATPEIAAVNKFAKELRKIQNDVVGRRELRKPNGRLNIQRWSQDQNLDTAFDRWNPSREADVQVEAVILVDTSISMAGGRIEQAARGAWALKASIEKARAGNVTVLTFSDRAYTLYRADEKAKANEFRSIGVNGGTEPFWALSEAHALLSRSKKALRLLVLLTDGEFYDSRNDDVIAELKKDGVTTVLIALTPLARTDNPFDAEGVGGHGAEFTIGIKNFSAFAGAFLKVVGELRYRAVNGRESAWWRREQATVLRERRIRNEQSLAEQTWRRERNQAVRNGDNPDDVPVPKHMLT